MSVPPVVLLIEDEQSTQRLLMHALERDGFRVVATGDAAGGLIALERERPDLVLLDVMLPDLSGREVCRRIRASSTVPIIMLTALDDEVDKVVGLELGADDYVTKPFGLRELRSRVRAALRRAALRPPSEEAGERIERAGIVLDLAQRTITVNGGPTELTFVEFEILKALMESPNRVFSRRQLLDAVWGSAEFRDQRTVDVHIRHLREKIEEDPARPRHIFTVRGVGYRFSE